MRHHNLASPFSPWGMCAVLLLSWKKKKRKKEQNRSAHPVIYHTGTSRGRDRKSNARWLSPTTAASHCHKFYCGALWQKSHLADQTEIPIIVCGGGQRERGPGSSLSGARWITPITVLSAEPFAGGQSSEWKGNPPPGPRCSPPSSPPPPQQRRVNASCQDARGQILLRRTNSGNKNYILKMWVQSARNLHDGIYLCDAAKSVGGGSAASMLTAAVCGVVNYTAFYPTRTPTASPRLCCSSEVSPSLIQANRWLTMHGLQNDLGQAGLWPQAFCKIFQ